MRVVMATAVACAFLSAPASADDAAALQAKLRAATAAVHSFRIQLSSPMGFTGVATVVNGPKQMHMSVASGPVTMEIFTSGGYLYQKIGSSGWQKRSLPSDAATVDLQRMFEGKAQVTTAPDVVEGGATYGRFTITTATASIPGAPAVGPVTLTCSYDKATLLMHACSSAMVTETFLGYDDPANVVTIPADALAAPDAGPLLPPGMTAPAASPAPSASP